MRKPPPDATSLPLRSLQEGTFLPGDLEEHAAATLINEAASPIALCAAVQVRLQRLERGLQVLEEAEDEIIGGFAFTLCGAVDEASLIADRLSHLLWDQMREKTK